MKVKFNLLHLLGLSLLLTWPPAVPAAVNATLVQILEAGCINWSTGTVSAIGVGSPTASENDLSPNTPSAILDDARRVAQSNLLKVMSFIRINAVSQVSDRLITSPNFRDGLITLARNAAVTHQAYLSDGTVEIELTMNLTGGFAQFVLPEEIRQVETVTTMTADEPMEGSPSSPRSDADGGPYTGLIVDATGIGAKPSLVPEVVDESGERVYGPAFVSREFAVSRGVSGFATTMAVARDDERVGNNPMVVKAVRTHSSGETDIVISRADAAQLRSSVVHLNFLKACRVSIVMDPDPTSHP